MRRVLILSTLVAAFTIGEIPAALPASAFSCNGAATDNCECILREYEQGPPYGDCEGWSWRWWHAIVGGFVVMSAGVLVVTRDNKRKRGVVDTFSHGPPAAIG